MGFPGQPSHPICHGVGARAHEPPYAHQAGGGEIAAGMVLAIEPGCYIEGGGGLRVEDNFLVTDDGRREAVAVPGRDRRRGISLEQVATPERSTAAPPGTDELEACVGEHRVVAGVRIDAAGLHRIALDCRRAVLDRAGDGRVEQRGAHATAPRRSVDVEAGDRPGPPVSRSSPSARSPGELSSRTSSSRGETATHPIGPPSR